MSDSDNETIVIASPHQADIPALRSEVLSGTFFGARHQTVASRLAAFLHSGSDALSDLREWFGAELHLLIADDSNSLDDAIDRDIAAIDAMISEQVDAILHTERLQQFEGRWRGLAWLVGGIEPGRRVKLRVLPITWPELCRDVERAPEFDRSLLFQRVYNDEFGMPGGEPFGLMLIDHAVRHRPAPGAPTDDVGALKQIAAVGAAAFTPMVLALHPSVLEVDGFSELETVQEIASPLRNTDHVRWRGLADRVDMRFVALTLPRLLARHPWGDDPGRREGFRYREQAPNIASRVWMNAGYAFAACAVRAFANHGWPADVRGVETDRVGGGLITDIAPEPFASGPHLDWPRTALGPGAK